MFGGSSIPGISNVGDRYAGFVFLDIFVDRERDITLLPDSFSQPSSINVMNSRASEK